MRSFLQQRLARRQVWMGFAFVATLAFGVILGTLLTSNQAEAQPTTTFTGSTALMFHFVKPASASDYEGVLQKLSAALQASQNEETDRQAQARGWKVYRAGADFTGQGAIPFMWLIDPVIPGANYAASTIMNEAFPDEIEALFETYNSSFTDGAVKQLPVNLELVADF